MFAAIYFTGDKKIDVINVKKVNRLENANKRELSTCDKVTVNYKIGDLDEAGRDIVVDVECAGVVICVNKGLYKLDSYNYIYQNLHE